VVIGRAGDTVDEAHREVDAGRVVHQRRELGGRSGARPAAPGPAPGTGDRPVHQRGVDDEFGREPFAHHPMMDEPSVDSSPGDHSFRVPGSG